MDVSTRCDQGFHRVNSLLDGAARSLSHKYQSSAAQVGIGEREPTSFPFQYVSEEEVNRALKMVRRRREKIRDEEEWLRYLETREEVGASAFWEPSGQPTVTGSEKPQVFCSRCALCPCGCCTCAATHAPLGRLHQSFPDCTSSFTNHWPPPPSSHTHRHVTSPPSPSDRNAQTAFTPGTMEKLTLPLDQLTSDSDDPVLPALCTTTTNVFIAKTGQGGGAGGGGGPGSPETARTGGWESSAGGLLAPVCPKSVELCNRTKAELTKMITQLSLGAVDIPEQDETKERTKRRAAEFLSRFARHHVYDIKRQLHTIEKSARHQPPSAASRSDSQQHKFILLHQKTLASVQTLGKNLNLFFDGIPKQVYDFLNLIQQVSKITQKRCAEEHKAQLKELDVKINELEKRLRAWGTTPKAAGAPKRSAAESTGKPPTSRSKDGLWMYMTRCVDQRAWSRRTAALAKARFGPPPSSRRSSNKTVLLSKPGPTPRPPQVSVNSPVEPKIRGHERSTTRAITEDQVRTMMEVITLDSRTNSSESDGGCQEDQVQPGSPQLTASQHSHYPPFPHVDVSLSTKVPETDLAALLKYFKKSKCLLQPTVVFNQTDLTSALPQTTTSSDEKIVRNSSKEKCNHKRVEKSGGREEPKQPSNVQLVCVQARQYEPTIYNDTQDTEQDLVLEQDTREKREAMSTLLNYREQVRQFYWEQEGSPGTQDYLTAVNQASENIAHQVAAQAARHLQTRQQLQ